MAYVFLGTKVSLSSDLIPAGFEAPAVTPFADAKYEWKTTLTVPGSVASSNRADSLLAIIQDETNGIETQIETKISSDFDIVNNDVNVWIDLRSLAGNKCESGSNDFLTDAVAIYKTAMNVYIQITVPS